jgi:hypothetical protein
MRRGMRYLAARQRPDGSWLPLWFGNQDRPQEENPVFGTSRVLMAYRDAGRAIVGWTMVMLATSSGATRCRPCLLRGGCSSCRTA